MISIIYNYYYGGLRLDVIEKSLTLRSIDSSPILTLSISIYLSSLQAMT